MRARHRAMEHEVQIAVLRGKVAPSCSERLKLGFGSGGGAKSEMRSPPLEQAVIGWDAALHRPSAARTRAARRRLKLPLYSSTVPFNHLGQRTKSVSEKSPHGGQTSHKEGDAGRTADRRGLRCTGVPTNHYSQHVSVRGEMGESSQCVFACVRV